MWMEKTKTRLGKSYLGYTLSNNEIFLFNCLPNNKTLSQSNLKDFADDIINVTEPFITQSQLLMTLTKKRFENIVGKGENFLLFQKCFLPFKNKFQFFIHIYFVVCKCFQCEPV